MENNVTNLIEEDQSIIENLVEEANSASTKSDLSSYAALAIVTISMTYTGYKAFKWAIPKVAKGIKHLLSKRKASETNEEDNDDYYDDSNVVDIDETE